MSRTPAIEAVGKTFGRLTVLKILRQEKNHGAIGSCLCSCGKKREYPISRLRSGDIKSCGCLKKERFTKFATKHGHRFLPEYKVWLEMKNRCNNPCCKGYKNYGGRGVKVCISWNNFENFIRDMGSRPDSNFSIERRNNNGNYEPGNCYWTTIDVQANNKRRSIVLMHAGKTMTLSQWSRFTGVPYQTLYSRWRALRTLDRILTP